MWKNEYVTCEHTKRLIQQRLNHDGHICEVELLTTLAHKDNKKGFVWSKY